MVPGALLNRMDLRYSVICAVVKALFTLLEPEEIQALVPSTRTTYEQWIRAKSKKPGYLGFAFLDIQPLPSGKDSAILWLGDRRIAKKVVLYLHGGGYVIPMTPGHLDLCWNNYIVTGAHVGVKVAVALLQYTLVPRGRMPTHLSQVVAAFNELRAQGFSPEDIIIGGDSGGGNLTMQFVSHLLHRHPQVAAVTLPQPLAGVVMVSPGLGSNADSRSFYENKNRDMITESIVRRLAGRMLPEGEVDELDSIDNPWARPLDANPTFFNKLGEVVRKMYFVVGNCELLADHSRSMAALVKKQAPDVVLQLDEIPGQPHGGILLEAIVGTSGESTRNMKTWYRELISEE